MLLLFTSTLAQADDMSADLATARSLWASGQVAQAATLLEPKLLQWAGEPEYDYLLGQIWYQLGKTGEALFAFERVLIADPSNVDVRLKAARISSERGNAGAAQALLAPLTSAKLNPTQQQEAEQIRTQLSDDTGSRPASVRGYLAAGAGWDDNVTGGPNLTAVMVPVTIMVPGARGKPPVPKLVMQSTSLGTATKSGNMLGTLEAGLSVRKAWNGSTWLTADGNLYQGINQSRKDVAESFANLNLGILKRTGNDFIGAALLGQNYMVSNATYRKSQGFRLNWLHPFNDHSNVTTYYQQLAFTYPTRATDNATRNQFGAVYQTTTSGLTMLYGLYAGREAAKNLTAPHLSFDIVGLNLGSQLIVNPNFSLSAGLLYEQHRHSVRDPFFVTVRSDVQQAVGIAADYRLAARWHLLPRYTYTHNVSNIALYDYIRNTFTLQLKWDFDNENQ